MMSDNLRRYRAIHEALRQWYPGEPSGNRARHQGDRILNFSNNNKVLHWSPTQGAVLRAPLSRRST
jgi:hypothetical protein